MPCGISGLFFDRSVGEVEFGESFDGVGEVGGRVFELVLGPIVAAEFELDGVDGVIGVAAVGLDDVAAGEAGMFGGVVQGKGFEALGSKKAKEALRAGVGLFAVA